jgi:hypothetical protein
MYSSACLLTVGAGAALYKGHQKVRKAEKFEPTLENINLLQITPSVEHNSAKGIPVSQIIERLENKTLPACSLLRVNKKSNPEVWSLSNDIRNEKEDNFIYSRGNSDRTTQTIDNLIGATGTPRIGGGILEAYKYIKMNIINGPCITFDYFDARTTLSFGQDNEKEMLKIAYNEMVSKNPHAKNIFVGLCRGARLGLDFATENPKNLAGMILESPLISFKDATHYMGKTYLCGFPGSGSFMHAFLGYWFPSYEPAKDDIITKLKNIPHDLPILIGHLKTDAVVSDDILHAALQELKERKNIYLVVIDDKTKKLFHGKLSETNQFQRVCNAFLAAYGKTHNAQLAQEGKQLLEAARANAHKMPQEWDLAIHA